MGQMHNQPKCDIFVRNRVKRCKSSSYIVMKEVEKGMKGEGVLLSGKAI